jgi:hypothetical protein
VAKTWHGYALHELDQSLRKVGTVGEYVLTGPPKHVHASVKYVVVTKGWQKVKCKSKLQRTDAGSGEGRTYKLAREAWSGT